MGVSRESLASRVKTLLELHGMTQQQLATVLGIDPSGLSRALKGDRDFKTIELGLIADTFRIPVGVLLEEEFSVPVLRMAARAQDATSDEAIAQGIDRAETMASIDNHLVKAGFPHDTQSISGRESTARTPWAEGEELADVVRSEAEFTADLPKDLAALATCLEDRLGVDVALEPLPEGIDGLSVSSGSSHLMLVNTTTAITRQRWTIAHELAHLMIGDFQELVIDKNLFGQKTPEETRANSFAAAFLMPAAQLRQRWFDGSKDLQHVAELLERYRVSVDALAFRLHNVGLVNAEFRDYIRGSRYSLGLLQRNTTQPISVRRPPMPLLKRAIMAYTEGQLGVRPFAEMLGWSPEALLDQLQPDEEEAEVLDSADQVDVA